MSVNSENKQLVLNELYLGELINLIYRKNE